MITVVDYGVGNIGALLNMLDHLGIPAESSGDPDRVSTAERLLLPGVGAFDRAMKALRSRGILGALETAVVQRTVPILGICLGMQLMARGSEEGIEPGLGWIGADVRRIEVEQSSGLKVPNVGWRTIDARSAKSLFNPAGLPERFYFTHSYHVICDSDADIAATVDYSKPLCCAIERRNIFGVQFHPEKSHRYGLALLARFAAIDQSAMLGSI